MEEGLTRLREPHFQRTDHRLASDGDKRMPLGSYFSQVKHC